MTAHQAIEATFQIITTLGVAACAVTLALMFAAKTGRAE